MPSLVAIDIETTGLDSQSDAIIEVAAVRFNGHRVEAEWSSLINPGRPIPPMITQLTNISNEMVRNAPPMRAILNELSDFVGTAPVVGHNVGFDLSFLQRYDILKLNEVVDTYELASVLLPTSSRYNLGALGLQLGFPISNLHRAMPDAQLTRFVFSSLYDKTLEMPIELLAEFVRLSEPLNWGAGWLFQQVLRARVRQPIPARRAGATDYGALFHEGDELLGPPLNPAAAPTPVDPDEAAAVLEHGGVFAHYFKSFEYRPQQVEMTRAIAQALSEGYHLMVEAGTGTGKSFAYLVPAAMWAYQNNTRVVISTNTITLQDQLIKKDIPDLCAALQLDLRAAVLKGRSNYLCPRRLEGLRQRGPESAEEMRVLAKVLVWLNEGGQGDRNEINLNGPVERDIWSRLSAEDEGCKAEVCMSRNGGACPFYMARQAAQSAHLLVVNHALLLSDVVTGSRVLPDYDYLIVDEGHHLESATTSALSFRVSQGDLTRLLREMGGSASGSLGRLLTLTRNLLRPSDFAALNQAVQRLTDLAFRLEHDLGQLFHAIDQFLESMRDGQPVSNYGQQVRVQSSTRTLPAWSEVEMGWDTAGETFKLLLALLNQVIQSFAELDIQTEELEDNIGVLGTLTRRLSEANGYLGGMIASPDAGSIYWIEVPPNNSRIILQVAPLHVGPLMEKYLWHEKSSVILTSATLTTNSEFEYLRSRLNADEADELVVGSPFDYENAALLFLANDIPEPADASAYQRAVEQSLLKLATSTGGKLLALFTSYAQLKRTAQALGPALAEKDIQLYEQGEGASTNTLLETFRESERAVLLGTRAFWEGVDIPGEALSVLVIVKLPFDVPSDPIIAARSETFEDPFNEYSLPEAILRFRQGFGRLIRTQSDHGVVAILDRRILTKRYGKLFIESLPQCKVQIGALRDLPGSAAHWLNL